MNQRSNGLNISPASIYQVLPPQSLANIMKPGENKIPANVAVVSSHHKLSTAQTDSTDTNAKEPLNLSTKNIASSQPFSVVSPPTASIAAAVRRAAEEKNLRMPVKKRKFSQHSLSNVVLSTTQTTTTTQTFNNLTVSNPAPSTTETTTAGPVTTMAATMPQVTQAVSTQAYTQADKAMPLPSRSDTPLDPSTSLMIATECHLATLPDEDGDTPLHIAVAQSNLLLVQRLIHLISLSSNSVDIYNDLRQTPLHLAVITKNWHLTKMLVEAGANPNLTDRNGQTAVHLICQRSNAHCLQALLKFSKFKIDLEARNYDGFTALHVAEFSGCIEMLKLLVSEGADINSQDNKSGRTALVHAVEGDDQQIIEFLLQSGADVNIQSYSGNTALHVASGRGFLHMVRLLLKHGADMSMRNSYCDTAASVAKNSNVTKVLRGVYQQPWLPPQQEAATPSEAAAAKPATKIPVIFKVEPVQEKKAAVRATISVSNKGHPATSVSYTFKQNAVATAANRLRAEVKVGTEPARGKKRSPPPASIEVEGMEVEETS